jgi:hypothetical protein
MPQGSFVGTFSLGGVSFSNGGTPGSVTEFDHPNPYEISLPVGKAVTDWVKTDANTAACNLAGGHGQTNGKFDVYWSGGVRYGVDGTIVTNALALDGGAGDDFPASATADVVVCKQVPIVCNIDGDNIQVIGVFLKNDLDSDGVAHVDFQDSGNATIAQLDLVAGSVAHTYQIALGATNPFTGNPITQAHASNGSTTGPATLYILSGEDSTP